MYHWNKYLQDLPMKIVRLERKTRVFRCFLALHHPILWVFEYLIKNAFINHASARIAELNVGPGTTLEEAAERAYRS